MNSAFDSATIFTKLDLWNVYHLVRIHEGDEWKTASNSPLGHFEYLVMPFSLTNTPALFQAQLNDVLRSHVHQTLQRQLENKLFVKAEKCEFLEYVIQSGQVKVDSEKIKTVAEWPRPENRKQLQRFLGFAHFYQFHPGVQQSGSPVDRVNLHQGPFFVDSWGTCSLLWTQEPLHDSSHPAQFVDAT